MRLFSPVLIALAVFAAGCGVLPSNANRPVIVATNSIVADWVRNVVGDRMTVATLVPVNADAHSYEPTPADVRRIAEARAVVAIGLGFEEWLDATIANAGGSARIIVVTDGMTPIEGGDHDEEEHREGGDDHDGDEHAGGEHDDEGGDEHESDPHVWHDVALALRAVDTIAAALAEMDPGNAAVYRQNADAYTGKLRALDALVRTETATVAVDRRKLVTNHDTFQYYARAYGFQVLGSVIGGVSTDREPSAAEIGALVTAIRAAGVPAIFAENIGSARLAETVAREANVRIVADLYTDALGQAGSPGATYEGMIRHNTARIVENLR